MSAGRPREAVGALARKTTYRVRRSAADRRTNRWWDSNPGRTVPSRGRPAGRVRHAIPAAMPSALSEYAAPGFVVLRISGYPAKPLVP